MTKDRPNGRAEEPRLERFDTLPDEAEPATDPWPSIQSRMGAQHEPLRVEARLRRRGRAWLQAAAAIALFAAGVASGRGVLPTTSPPQPSSMDETLALAAEVQRTGSEYVAALTAFTSVMDSLSQDVLGQGTHAAFATLNSAADQLAALTARNPDEPDAEAVQLGGLERRVRF